MSSINYIFDKNTNTATVIVHPGLPRIDVSVPNDIIQFNRIEEYLQGFVMPENHAQALFLLEEERSKTVMYVSPSTLNASPLLLSILNKCSELYPFRFKWTIDINDTTVNDCFYDYRFNEEFVLAYSKLKLATKKINLKLQNKSVLNEILRTTNLDYLDVKITSPNILSLKTPKNINDIKTFFVDGYTYIVKPVYGFQSNSRIYDRKQYTNSNDFISDIIKQHRSLDNFFLMQKNQSKFIWTTDKQNETPVFIQQVVPVQGVYTCYTVCNNYVANLTVLPEESSLILESSQEAKLNEIIRSVMYLNRLTTNFVTFRAVLSNDNFYIIDLSQSMYPVLTGDTPNKNITDLAKLLFSALTLS
jgi:hypothetical protein